MKIIKHLGVIFYFTIITIFYSYPLVQHIDTHIPYGYEGPTDGIFALWNIMSNINNIRKGQVFSTHGNIFYPQKDVLSLNDRSLYNSIVALLISKLIDNRALIFNVLYFMVYILSGYGMFLLVHHHTSNYIVSLISSTAVTFAGFYYYPQNLYANSWQWLFFALYFLHRYLKEHRMRWGVSFAFFYILTWLSTLYIGFMLALIIVAYFAFYSCLNKTWFSNITINFSLVFFISSIVIIPYLLPYMKNISGITDANIVQDKINTSYTVLSFFVIKRETSWFWYHLTGGVLKEMNEWEGFYGSVITICTILFFKTHFSPVFQNSGGAIKVAFSLSKLILFIAGFLIIADTVHIIEFFPYCGRWNTIAITNYLIIGMIFCFIIFIVFFKDFRHALFSQIKTFTPETRFYFYLLIVSFLLSLGPLGGLYLVFDRVIPGFGGIRAPHRLFKAGLVAMGILSSSVLVQIERFKRSKIILLLILVFTIVEYYNNTVKLYPLDNLNILRDCYRWLMAETDDFAILEIPTQKPQNYYKNIEEKRRDLLLQTQYMYYSTFHNKKIVNGYSSFLPYWYTKFLEKLTNFPDMDVIIFLKSIDVRYILVHTDLMDKEGAKDLERKIMMFFPKEKIKKFHDTIVIDIH